MNLRLTVKEINSFVSSVLFWKYESDSAQTEILKEGENESRLEKLRQCNKNKRALDAFVSYLRRCPIVDQNLLDNFYVDFEKLPMRVREDINVRLNLIEEERERQEKKQQKEEQREAEQRQQEAEQQREEAFLATLEEAQALNIEPYIEPEPAVLPSPVLPETNPEPAALPLPVFPEIDLDLDYEPISEPYIEPEPVAHEPFSSLCESESEESSTTIFSTCDWFNHNGDEDEC